MTVLMNFLADDLMTSPTSQRLRCNRLERFFNVEKVVLKTHWATRGVVKFLQRWRCNSRSLDWLLVAVLGE
jgi:hypothetical protein